MGACVPWHQRRRPTSKSATMEATMEATLKVQQVGFFRRIPLSARNILPGIRTYCSCCNSQKHEQNRSVTHKTPDCFSLLCASYLLYASFGATADVWRIKSESSRTDVDYRLLATDSNSRSPLVPRRNNARLPSSQNDAPVTAQNHARPTEDRNQKSKMCPPDQREGPTHPSPGPQD